MNVDPKRYPPKAIAAAIGKAKDRVLGAEDFAGMAANLYEETVAQIYAEYERRQAGGGSARLRRPDQRDGPAVPRSPRGPASTTRSASATS